jgi:hypothetical protein
VFGMKKRDETSNSRTSDSSMNDQDFWLIF